jgi:hypothetical protein
MARDKANQDNINNADPVNYPNARIKDNTGLGDGTPVDETVYGDQHEFFAKLMRLYGIEYNGLPDNEATGYQLVEAARALASKNDFILSLTSTDNKLSVPIKIGKMLPNEQVICKAAVDLNTETTIVGSDNTETAVVSIGDFKTDEYVRLVKTATAVVLIRLVDSVNLDAAVDELAYLKAATLAEELDGTLDTVATTPLNNLLAFVERVNGAESNNALAIASVRNGLLSKEAAQAIEDFTDPTSLIKVTSATNIAVTAWQEGNQQDNNNFNYVDVFPPTGKTIDDLQGFMASHSRIRFDGNVNDDDRMWCRWEVQATKVRVICGASELEEPPRVNWFAIWI